MTSYIYVPSIDILRNIITKKDQKICTKFKYLIGIRHHSDINRLIDHLINIVVSHFHNNICISVSTSVNMNKKIPKELLFICDYIRFIEPYDINPYPGFNDYRSISDHIEHDIDYEYFIYHSSSEYYVREVTPDSIELPQYERYTREYDKKEITDSWNSKGDWYWTKYVKECSETKNLFLTAGIPFIYDQMNGIVVPYKIMIGYLNFIKKYIDNSKTYHSKNMGEILLQSYINGFWYKVSPKSDKSQITIITNCFWKEYGLYGRSKKTEQIILKNIVNTINNDKNYYSVKRCDGHNNSILKYAHDNYMKNKIVEILHLKNFK